MDTKTTTSYKDPINEIVSTLPETASTGYRVILDDDNKIYQFNGTEWEEDSTLTAGTMARLIGKDSSRGDIVSYYKLMTGNEMITPFYPGGGSMTNRKVLMFQDEIHILRSDGTDWDIVRYNPVTGDSDQPTSGSAAVPKDYCIDASGNLWIAFSTGVMKIDATDSFARTTLYTTASSTLPFAWVDKIVADGNRIWILNNQSNDWKIARYDSGEWEELTDQFYTDTGIVEGTKGNVTVYDIFANDGKIYFSINGSGTWSGRLFYYDQDTEVFALVSLYDDYAPTRFCVLDAVLFAIEASAGVITIQNILTGATPAADDVIYTSEADKVADFFRVNEDVVYAAGDTKIYILNGTRDAFEESSDLAGAISDVVSPASILDLIVTDTYLVFLQDDVAGAEDVYFVSKEDGWDYFPRNGFSKDDWRRGKVESVSDGDTIDFSAPLGSSGDDLMPITLKALDASGDEVACGFSDLTNSNFIVQLAAPADIVYYCFAKSW